MPPTQLPTQIETWQMVEPAQNGGGLLEQTSLPLPELKPGEVLVEIAGCGVCGSDIQYFYEGVPTAVRPPLTLGHEISGTVIAGDEPWLGREVIVPTIIPCRECEVCRAGRANRCLNQKMPGNSMGIYGGFSSHIVVPGRDLCPVADRGDIPLARLAITADAVATPYQAARRANLQPGDRVIVIGVTGGCGAYMAQWAKAMGAEAVIGVGRNEEKLERLLSFGVDYVINSRDKSPWDIQKAFWRICRKNRLSARSGWKIFEFSGTKAGQELALALLGYTGTLVIAGYSTAEISYTFSRLSPLDADLIGTWGCLPEYYPLILDEILKGAIQIEPFVEERPMSRIKETFETFHHQGSPARRVVLVPDF